MGDDADEPVQRAASALGEARRDQDVRQLAGGDRVAEQQEPDERRKAVGTAASRRRYTSRSTCVKIGSPVVCRRRAIPAPV